MVTGQEFGAWECSRARLLPLMSWSPATWVDDSLGPCEDHRMEEQGSVIDLLNGLLGVYWTSYAQHQTHVALIDSWGIAGLARGMQAHIDDEPVTIGSVLNRLLDLGGRPDFALGEAKIGTSLREVLENDLEIQRSLAPV